MERDPAQTRKIKIAGREFDLAYTTWGLLEMQRRIRDFNQNQMDAHLGELDETVTILYILAQNGAKLTGKALDADQEWFELHIPPRGRKYMEIQIAINETMADGMMMETEEDEKRGQVIDVVLAEIQKKRAGTDSPGDR